MHESLRVPGMLPVRQPAAWRLAAPSLVADVLNGLQSIPKRLSPTYFYDERGSQLFDQISEVPDDPIQSSRMQWCRRVAVQPMESGDCAESPRTDARQRPKKLL